MFSLGRAPAPAAAAQVPALAPPAAQAPLPPATLAPPAPALLPPHLHHPHPAQAANATTTDDARAQSMEAFTRKHSKN